MKNLDTKFQYPKTEAAEANLSPVIFVSYSHDDGRQCAKEIVDLLEEHGLQPWMDDELHGYYDHRIEQQIRECDIMVALITEDVSHDRSFVRKEIHYALGQCKPIVPIVIDGAEPPILLCTNQFIRFSSSQEIAEIGEKLVHRIHQELAAATKAPPNNSQRRSSSWRLLTRIWRWAVLCLSLLAGGYAIGRIQAHDNLLRMKLAHEGAVTQLQAERARNEAMVQSIVESFRELVQTDLEVSDLQPDEVLLEVEAIVQHAKFALKDAEAELQEERRVAKQ